MSTTQSKNFSLKFIITSMLVFAGLIANAQVSDAIKQAFKNAANDSVRHKLVLTWMAKKTNDSARADLLIEVGREYRSINMPIAITYLDSGFRLSKRINYLRGIANAEFAFAMIKFGQGKLSEAIESFNISLGIHQKLNNKRKEADCLHNIGNLYAMMGRPVESVNYILKAIEIYESQKDTTDMESCYYNIGNALHQTGNFDLEEYYVTKAMAIAIKQKKEPEVVYNQQALGNVKLAKRQFTEAESYYRKSLILAEKLGIPDLQASGYQGLGLMYVALAKPKDAIKNLETALSLQTENNAELLVSIYINLASAYNQTGEFDLALKNLKKAEEYITDDSYLLDGISATQMYANTYEGLGNYKEALRYQKKSAILKDSVTNIQNLEKIAALSVTYESKQKEQTIRIQELEIDEQNKINNQKNIQLLIAVITLAIVISVAIFAFVTYRRVNRQRLIIDQKNNENELLLSEIHHRVKNNLQVISSLLSLQERSMESGTAKSALHEGKERIKSMELVHKLLYQKGSFTGIGMQDYVQLLVEGLLESFGKDEGTIQLELTVEALTLDVDTAIPIGLILNELVVNALKHNKTKSGKLNLIINLYEKNGQLQLEVKDNGSGNPSMIETSDSFGMRIVKALVRQLNGNMHIKEDNGISFEITFKNYKLTPHGN